MDDKQRKIIELLTSMSAAASDIQRWTLQMATMQRLSADRRLDIAHAAERIAVCNRKLGEL